MDKYKYDMNDRLDIGVEEEIHEIYDDYIQSLEKRDEIRNLSRNDTARILVEQIVKEESYISVLYKVMKLLSDKENNDLGIENADFTMFLKNIGIKSLETAWLALIGLGVASIVGFITSIKIRQLKKGKEIEFDNNNNVTLTLDETDALTDFFIKRTNKIKFYRQVVQTDRTLNRKYKKGIIEKLNEIEYKCVQEWEELISTKTIAIFSKKPEKNIINEFTKKIKI